MYQIIVLDRSIDPWAKCRLLQDGTIELANDKKNYYAKSKSDGLKLLWADGVFYDLTPKLLRLSHKTFGI